MIALAFSAVVAIYLLIPDVLFRFILGLFVPVAVSQKTKVEEIRRAVGTLVVLFAFALILVWYVPFFRSNPCSFTDTIQERASDYEKVASGLYSEALFKEYGQQFWDALARTLMRQARFATWYYLIVIGVACGVGYLGKDYGKRKQSKLYSWFADAYLFPHMSQWHAILTGFTFSGKTTVKADVLMTDDTLYRGEVAEYFLTNDGTLSGLFLKNPERFDRPRYLTERNTWGTTRSVKTFWRPIPSAKLYLVGAKIINLNLNYEPSTAPQRVVQKYVDGILKSRGGKVSFTIQVNSSSS